VRAPLAAWLEAEAERAHEELGRAYRVLDVGCGSGVVGFTAIRDVPGATLVSIDSSPVLEVARELAARMGVAERVEFISGGVESIPSEMDFDLELLIHVAQYLDDASLDTALRRVADALRPGGRMMLVTIIDDPGTPGFSPNWTSAIEMFLASPGVSLRTPDELTGAVMSAGFGRVERHHPWALSAFR
jgi:C-methyltransferase